jgi:hypothetical protein
MFKIQSAKSRDVVGYRGHSCWPFAPPRVSNLNIYKHVSQVLAVCPPLLVLVSVPENLDRSIPIVLPPRVSGTESNLNIYKHRQPGAPKLPRVLLPPRFLPDMTQPGPRILERANVGQWSI